MQDKNLNTCRKSGLQWVNQSGQLGSFDQDSAGITPDELFAARNASEISGFTSALMNAFYTFSIFPVSKGRDVADEDPAAAIASDWNNVFTDLSISFMKEATDLGETPEPSVDG